MDFNHDNGPKGGIWRVMAIMMMKRQFATLNNSVNFSEFDAYECCVRVQSSTGKSTVRDKGKFIEENAVPVASKAGMWLQIR